MVRSLLALVSLATILPALVSAHGQLRGVTIAGKFYDAPDLYYDGSDRNKNTPIRKGYRAEGPSYLLPTNFADDNKMACEEAGAAPAVADVNPGDEVVWNWQGATTELSDQGYAIGTWVHAMGFTSTWIGKCDGGCQSVDASQIGWQKIDFNGLRPGDIDTTLRNAMANKPEPYRSTGIWGMAQMIENGSQYSSRVPAGLKSGQYILRSEISAVHNPFNGGPTTGPQNYVGCLQINVVNGGDVDLPYGTKAGSLYEPNGDFAHYSVFENPALFIEPGPQQWNGASGNSNGGNQNSGNQNTGSNNGQQNQDQGNQNQGGNGDSSNSGQQGGQQGSQQGGDNSNNGQQGGDTSNNGQQNGDNGQQNQNQGGDNSGNNSGSGNSSTDNGTKQCRRRSNKKRSSKRTLHAAHAKRHH
jgi:cellulase